MTKAILGKIATGLVLILALGAYSCGQAYVISTITSYNNMPNRGGRTVAILAYPADRESSLEYQSYRLQLADKFTEKGMTVVPRPEEAELVAFLSYGIDRGDKTPGPGSPSVPTPLQAGVNEPTTLASAYNMPHYGTTAYSGGAVTGSLYRRDLAVDIVDRVSLEQKQPIKIYEGRVGSRGVCTTLPSIFPYMLTALFKEFPGRSGRVETIQSPTDLDCKPT
jgi:hypothetical protein